VTPLPDGLAAASNYGTAAFGLAGSLIGGLVVGATSIFLARQARETAERAWIRDGRRDTYGRFIANAQALLIACQAYERNQRGSQEGSDGSADEKLAVENAHNEFFEIYVIVQTVAEPAVVDAARIYGYRLLELEAELTASGVLGRQYFSRVAALVREARQATVEAMRRDLGLSDSAGLGEVVNAFAGTDLEAAYGSSRGSGTLRG
jgi:hypothetical protein